MLTSFQTVPAGVPAFPELAFVEQHAGRSFVLLESSNLPPSLPELVDFEPVSYTHLTLPTIYSV